MLVGLLVLSKNFNNNHCKPRLLGTDFFQTLTVIYCLCFTVFVAIDTLILLHVNIDLTLKINMYFFVLIVEILFCSKLLCFLSNTLLLTCQILLCQNCILKLTTRQNILENMQASFL